jgi:DNA-binding MarR family transcriptional regulator
VSKQAISAIATELEELGYIHRVSDPADARQVLLHFTGRGLGLIADSAASVDTLYAELTRLAGAARMETFCGVLRDLYRGLHLEEDVFGNSAALDIRALARQLQQQLGEEGARALGQLLLSPAQAEA